MRLAVLVRAVVPAALVISIQGCVVATVAGTAVGAGIEVAKIPFKVGGAVYDVATDGDDKDGAGGD